MLATGVGPPVPSRVAQKGGGAEPVGTLAGHTPV